MTYTEERAKVDVAKIRLRERCYFEDTYGDYNKYEIIEYDDETGTITIARDRLYRSVMLDRTFIPNVEHIISTYWTNGSRKNLPSYNKWIHDAELDKDEQRVMVYLHTYLISNGYMNKTKIEEHLKSLSNGSLRLRRLDNNERLLCITRILNKMRHFNPEDAEMVYNSWFPDQAADNEKMWHKLGLAAYCMTADFQRNFSAYELGVHSEKFSMDEFHIRNYENKKLTIATPSCPDGVQFELHNDFFGWAATLAFMDGEIRHSQTDERTDAFTWLWDIVFEVAYKCDGEIDIDELTDEFILAIKCLVTFLVSVGNGYKGSNEMENYFESWRTVPESLGTQINVFTDNQSFWPPQAVAAVAAPPQAAAVAAPPQAAAVAAPRRTLWGKWRKLIGWHYEGQHTGALALRPQPGHNSLRAGHRTWDFA